MTLAEQRTERLARVAEVNERNRRIYEAAMWVERHRVTPDDMARILDHATELKAKVGRPLSLAEIAGLFPPPKGTR